MHIKLRVSGLRDASGVGAANDGAANDGAASDGASSDGAASDGAASDGASGDCAGLWLVGVKGMNRRRCAVVRLRFATGASLKSPRMSVLLVFGWLARFLT
jgi:hypothetical protein